MSALPNVLANDTGPSVVSTTVLHGGNMTGRMDENMIKAATGEFDLESIERLDLSGRNIRRIDGLATCVNLQVLQRHGGVARVLADR